MLNRAMKDSGIEWIGKLPEEWDVSKIGSHFRQRTDKVSDIDYEPLSVTKDGIVPQLDSAAKSSNHSNRKLVLKEDFVINSRSDRKMSSGIAYQNGSVSVINTVIYSDTISKEYSKYLLKNYSFAEEFYRWGSGIVADLWSTRWDKMKNITIPVPNIKEQENISKKLDEISEKIDSITNKTQQSIEELKKYKQSIITEAVTKGLNSNTEMKDSGITWIGNIPCHWKINKMKFVTRIKDDKQDFNKGDPYVGLENVESFSGKINGFSKLEKISKGNSFDVGDVLYSKLRPYLAKAFIANMSGTCSGEFVIFSQYQGDKKYLLYWLISELFTEYINATSYGAKMPRSSWDYIKETSIPQPPKEEELSIIKYIEKKTTYIDKLIFKKEKVIGELEQYKKSLIYEYVTGKKEV